MLHISGESKYPYLILDLRKNAFSILPDNDVFCGFVIVLALCPLSGKFFFFFL